MKRSKKLIILDLDGTLVDSLPDITSSLNHTAEKLGFKTFSPDTVRGFVGDGVRVLIERAFPVTEAIRSEALGLFLTEYKAHLVDRTRPFPGIEPLLSGLKKDGYPAGVLSNKLENLSRTVVRHFPFLWEALSFVYGGDSFREKKPSPLPVLEILKKWGRAGEDAVIIGDSPNDIRCGKAAGINTIGVTYGFMPHEILRVESPDVLVGTPGEIREAIDSLIKR